MDILEVKEMVDRYVDKYININYPDLKSISDDIKQDILVKFLDKNKYNRKKGAFSTYLLTITRNHIIDILRKQSSGYRALNKYKERLEEPFYEEDFERSIDMVKVKEEVDEALNKLNRVDRYIIVNKYMKEGKTDKDIMEYLGMDKKKFYRYVNRAKEQLLTYLNTEYLSLFRELYIK